MAEDRVILHGMWASPFVKRVELALKVKGIPFDYVEEDLMNKSPELLQYNPVHKKVPVLIHNGKPIAESMVILEYIDETWKNEPRLLPEGPYDRAKVRFWASFLYNQVFEAMAYVLKTEGEEQKRAFEGVHEKLKVLEEGISCFPEGYSLCSGGQSLGLLDIVMCSVFGAYKVHEEVYCVKFIDPEKYPLISSWVFALVEMPVVKEIIPPHEKLVPVLQFLRKKALSAA